MHFSLKRIFVIALLIHTFSGYGLVIAQEVDHWESIVRSSDTWKYFPATYSPPSGWYLPGFDDSTWLSGKGGIGYGDGDDSTVISPVITLYLRKTFIVIDTSVVRQVLLPMDYDDGFVAYLNGSEIARANIGSPGDHPSWDQTTPTDHEALLYQGLTPESFSISTSLLIQGQNVLAIEVHNVGITSSDMSSNAWLSFGVTDTAFTYQPIPDWFHPVTQKFSSNLPLVIIDTRGQTIMDEDRIMVHLRVIDHGPGMLNSLSDTGSNYNGLASIELRGESSQMFPKKSYSFELQDSLGQKLNFPLMGLPEENDWILHAHYSDKTCMRNVLTYKIARDMGMYATRTKYCEVFLNNDYVGLYSLMEKIKQDKNRVDISKLKPDDTSGDQLTGGYIVRVDKVDNNDYPPWISVPNPQLPGTDNITFQYDDPSGWDLTSEQQAYIKEYIYRFESSLSSNNYLDPVSGYSRYVDMGSFVDFLIVNEITKNIDGYLFSTFFFKDRDSKGGKLNAGPVWDFDLGYANVDYHIEVVNIPGWIYEESLRMYWWRRMMTDHRFVNLLSCRWHSLRSGVLSHESLFSYIDSLANVLQEPLKRNFSRWPILGVYVWPNYYVGPTYADELYYLKNWLSERLYWMDENIPVSCVTTGIVKSETGYQLFSIYPNPFRDEINIELGDEIEQPVAVTLTDLLGKELFSNEIMFLSGATVRISWPEKESASQGLYLLKIASHDGKLLYTGKIIRE